MDRPASVTKGVTLLYTAIALAFLAVLALTLYTFSHQPLQFPLPRAIAVEVIIIILFLFLTYQIGKGANWARVTMLILVILNVISKIAYTPIVFATSFMVGVSSIVVMILQIIAMCFLYSKASNSWFKGKEEGL